MYDGHHFKVFSNDASDTSSLIGNTIFKIHEDWQRRTWIATNDGIDLLNRKTFSYTHIPILNSDGTKADDAYIRDITEDPQGNIFIANSENILKYNPVQKVFHPF